MANHSQGTCKVLLVKDPNASEKDNTSLQDLATYLGTKLTTEKNGSLVDKLTIKDFVIVDKVFADMGKTIISQGKKSKTNIELSALIEAIRKELEKDKDDKRLKERLAALTNGMVTLKIGGATNVEMIERIYRYEDALNATRAAMKDGVLVGGGVALLNAFKPKEHHPELATLYRRFCEGNIRQIAENCGQHPDTVVAQIKASKNKHFGFNAVNEQVEDLWEAGVVDPFNVTVMAVKNAVSIAGQIISSNYLIVPDLESEE
jgi:chaperonin GroEL